MTASVIIKALLILALCSVCYARNDKCYGSRCRRKVAPIEELATCGFIHSWEHHAHGFAERCASDKECPNQLTCQHLHGCEFISFCDEIPATPENILKHRPHCCAVRSNRMKGLLKSLWHCHTDVECDPDDNKGCNADFDCTPSDECDYFIPCPPIENPFFDGHGHEHEH